MEKYQDKIKQMNKITLFILIVFAVPTVAYFTIKLYHKKIQPLPILGPVQQNNKTTIYHTIPDFTFTTQKGEDILSKDLWGNIIIANFFFTHCTTICPEMSASLQKIQREFYDNEQVIILSYTVDPRRDSVERLNEYANIYDAKKNKWFFLTGQKQDIYRLARKGYFLTAQDSDKNTIDFIHSEKLVLIDQQRQIRGYYDGTNTSEVKQLIYDIKRLNKIKK